jgi:cytochrome c oxidase subunit 2
MTATNAMIGLASRPMASLHTMIAETGIQELLWFGGRSYTEAGSQADWMFLFIWWASVIAFVGLMVAMLVFAIRYRRRKGQPAPASPGHNTPLEITWTVIPTIVFLVMFVEGFRGYINLNYAPVGAIEANVLARQWAWQLQYAGGQMTTEVATTTYGPEAHEQEQTFSTTPSPVWYFPEGQPVLLRMTSQDVIHSFWIPDFRYKQDVFPNRYTSFTFTPEPLDDSARIMEDAELGAYPYRDHVLMCAEYCGDDHSEMAGLIRIVPMEIYQAKLEIFGSPRGTLAERGQIVAQQNGCFSCHSVDGAANTGPTWKNLYNTEHQYADGSTVVASDNHIRESIYVPSAKIRAGYPNQMVSYQGSISAEQLGWIIAYMKTLSEATPESELAATQVDPDAEGAQDETGEATEGGDAGDAGLPAPTTEGTPSAG